MVSFHGHLTTSIAAARRRAPSRLSAVSSSLHEATERPPNPQTLLSTEELQEKVDMLLDWFQDKRQVLTLTGAGLSTESGIPDYRGHNGSYHRNNHKPMIHDQFMTSQRARQRYWGRSLVGWRQFTNTQPNSGHMALVELEKMGKIGVATSERHFLSIITQNVDTLHRKAGSQHVCELHGRTDRLQCMQCGSYRDRVEFHDELEDLNREWLQLILSKQDSSSDLRPDGDAHVNQDNYDHMIIPSCKSCTSGFLKPDVVFFGDVVPKDRVAACHAAVEAADGLLCIGSSLAVHSAYRFVKQAHNNGIPIAILNVGETRAEREGLKGALLKVEAPAGSTLGRLVEYYNDQDNLDT